MTPTGSLKRRFGAVVHCAMVLLSGVGCSFPQVDATWAECPCAAGWTCNEDLDRCEAELAPQRRHGDGGGDDSGAPAAGSGADEAGVPRPTSGPRFTLAQTRFFSHERLKVPHADVLKGGKPFVGLYERFGHEAIETHDVRFKKGQEVATGTTDFAEQVPGAYDVRLVYDTSRVVDALEIIVVSDRDEDRVEDDLDACPDDGQKAEVGVCGCGTADHDTDGDGRADCMDECPHDASKIYPGMCGCGFLDSRFDQDSDGLSDCYDECPGDPNKTRVLQCGCGKLETDSDADGTADCQDKCPSDPNKTNKGVCGCGVADVDSDGDGTANCLDLCADDPAKTAPGELGCGTPEGDALSNL